MGMDPLTIGLIGTGAAGLWGAQNQNQANRTNANAQQRAFQAQLAQQGLINQQAMGMMQQGQGQNPYSSMLMQLLGGGGVSTGLQAGSGAFGIPGVNIPGQVSGGAGGGMTFQPPSMLDPATYQASGYTPAQIGLPPSIDPMMLGGIPQVGYQNVSGQRINAPRFNPSQIGLGQIPQLSAQQVGAGQINQSQFNAPMVDPSGLPQVNPGMVNAPQINLGALGSQGFNTGQDALMQMINRGIPAQQDPTVALGLQQAGQQFSNSDLFSALAPLDQRLIDQQAAQLQGSAGSLGARFGTAMMEKESQLRGNFAQNIAVRNAGLQQQSFENAAQRGLQATGIGAQREQFFAGLPLQQAQLQQQAALGLQSGALQQSGLMAQLLQANQGAGLQAGLANQQAGIQAGGMNQDAIIRAVLANQGVGMQAGLANQQNAYGTQSANVANQLQASLANQGAGLQAGGQNLGAIMQALLANQQTNTQAGLANQSTGLAANQATAQQALQAALANQGAGLQSGQMNQSALLQAMLANQGAGLQAQTGNAANWLQSMLANQGSANQAGQFNATAQNQAGQFNAGQMQNTGQFNAAQGQQYNQFLSGILGQAAGLQGNQTAQNAQLLAIMAGLPGVNAPQQQPSALPGAVGDLSQLLMFLPLLQGLNKPTPKA